MTVSSAEQKMEPHRLDPQSLATGQRQICLCCLRASTESWQYICRLATLQLFLQRSFCAASQEYDSDVKAEENRVMKLWKVLECKSNLR